MSLYEIDPVSIVEDAERTPFHPQMDGQTDGWMDKVKPVYPFQLRWSGVYNKQKAIWIELLGCHSGNKIFLGAC